MKPIQARSSIPAPETAIGEFMFMPAGHHTIHCLHGNKSVEAQVHVDRGTAAVMQQQLDACKARSAHKPFFDFDHDEKQASFWPEQFAWSDSPAPGVYVRGEWSRAGKEAIEGKSYRAFSPVFHIDDLKKKPATVVFCEQAGLNFGGLVNNPAFKKISPIWAKHAGASSAPNHKPTTAMTDTEKAALEAQIQQAKTEIVELQALDQTVAENAEALLAKNNELELMNQKLATKIAEDKLVIAEKENLINRTAKAQQLVAAAVKRGAIATKNTVLQSKWVERIVADPTAEELLVQMNGSPALSGGLRPPLTTEDDPPRRLTAISRAETSNVLNHASALFARQVGQNIKYKDRPEMAAELATLYAKEIKPRYQEGDDMPLKGLNSLGTLAQTLVAIRALELLTLKFPLLEAIATDFSGEIVSYGDVLKTRIISIPTVQTFNTTTGWPTQSDVTTTDVSITYDQFKGVPVRFLGHETAGTLRRLFDEIAPAQAYALGKDMVDYVYALITAAYTNTVTAAGLGTFGRSTVVDIGGILDDAGVPDMNRFLLLARPYFSALSKDNAIVTLDQFQALQMIQKGLEMSQVRSLEGFNVIKAVNLPATSIAGKTLKGFGGSRSSLVVASRLSSDYVNANPGASNGILTVVSLPAGLSANLVQFVDHNGAYSAQRMELIYGANRGQVAAGALLTDV